MNTYRIRFTNLKDLNGDHPETHEFHERDDSHAQAYFNGFIDAVEGGMSLDQLEDLDAVLETGYGEYAREVPSAN